MDQRMATTHTHFDGFIEVFSELNMTSKCFSIRVRREHFMYILNTFFKYTLIQYPISNGEYSISCLTPLSIPIDYKVKNLWHRIILQNNILVVQSLQQRHKNKLSITSLSTLCLQCNGKGGFLYSFVLLFKLITSFCA